MTAELARLKVIYQRLASVLLQTPEAGISGHTVIDGESVGEMVSEMAVLIHNAAASHGAQLNRDHLNAVASVAAQDIVKLFITQNPSQEFLADQVRSVMIRAVETMLCARR